MRARSAYSEMIAIDGSDGEGGGQVLRTSLAISALLKLPFRITGIRAGRPNPGLAAQHLTSVRAVAAACHARVGGDFLGSQTLEFHPGAISCGSYSFDCGTAGSTSLVLQSILPALLFSDGACEVRLAGGTENKWAPTGLCIQGSFLPLLRQFGVAAGFEIERFGFYPAGGGIVRLKTKPVGSLTPINCLARGKLKSVRGISLATTSIPYSVAERQKTRCLKQLSELGASDAKIELAHVDSESPGSEVFLSADFGTSIAGFCALGEKGKPSEKVAGEAMHGLKEFMASGASVDEHASDQLLLYAALAKGDSVFSIPVVSSHFETNARVLKQFLPDCEITWLRNGPCFRVDVAGVGHLAKQH